MLNPGEGQEDRHGWVGGGGVSSGGLGGGVSSDLVVTLVLSQL